MECEGFRIILLRMLQEHEALSLLFELAGTSSSRLCLDSESVAVETPHCWLVLADILQSEITPLC